MPKQHRFLTNAKRPLPSGGYGFLLLFSLCITCLCLSSATAAEKQRTGNSSFSSSAIAKLQPAINLTPEEQAWLAQHPDIVLGAPTDYPPMAIKRADGTHVGFLVDFFEQVSRQLDNRVRLHIEDSWADIQKKAQNREIDGLAIGARDPSREVYYNATDIVIPTYFSVFARSKNEYRFKRFSDLKGMRIGYKRAARPTRSLLEKLPATILKPYDDHESMTQALLSKEVDVIVAWMGYDHWRKKRLQGTIDNIFLIKEYPIEMVTHVRKDWPELIPILNKAIASLQQEELPLIINKWFGHWPQEYSAPRVPLTLKERAWLEAHPEITLGTSASYPPHVITNPDGTYTGVLPNFYEQISQVLNARVGLEIGKVWIDVQKKAQNRELDGLAIGGRDPNRDALYNASDTLYPSYFSVFAPARHNLRIKSFSDLDGMRIGYKRGARPARTRLEKLPAATPMPYDDHESMTQALLSKEIDVIVAWMSYDHWRKKTLQGTIDKIYMIQEYPLEMVIYIRKDWPELIPILNKAIVTLQHDELPRIINKWFGYWPQIVKPKIKLTNVEKSWIDKKHIVRVRITDWPPYLIVNDEAPPHGIVIEYLKLIEERTGITFKFEVTAQPFAEFLEGMKQRQGPDMTAVIVPTPEREQYLSFSKTYLSSPYVIFIRRTDESIIDIEGLTGKTLAVPRGFVVQAQLAREYPEIRMSLFDSDEKALQAVATGQVDAYIGNLTVASHIIHKRGLSDLHVTAASPFKEQSLSMGNRNDWPELTSIINKALASITEEEKTVIRRKYLAIKYEQGINKSKVLRWVLIVGGTAFGIVLFFVVWNKQLSRKVNEQTSQLLESETRFRATFEQVAVGVALVSPDGKFLRLNRKFCDIVGYSHAEMIDLTFQDITHPDDLDADLKYLEQVLSGEIENYTMDKRYCCKDGSIVWVNLNVSLVADQEDNPKYFVAVIKDISERKQSENKIAEYQKRLKALAYEVTLVEEKERRAIAADLHDYVGQSLALARMQLASASRTTSETRLTEKLDEISATLLKALEDTQTLMLELGSHSIHDMGLSAALSDWLESEIRNKHRIATELTDNIPKSHRKILPPDMRTILYRNVRELVVNVVKHARANRVRVHIEEWGTGIRIVVEDDGIGFNPHGEDHADKKVGGFGLFRVEELMADIGGSLQIVSAPGKGCTATLSVPFIAADSQRRDLP